MSRPPTTVVHCKKTPFDVYIGRSQNLIRGKWGNRFTNRPLAGTIAMYHAASIEDAIAKHRHWLLRQPALMNDLVPELRGRVLGCWCKPGLCHGDTYVELADACTCDRGGDFCVTHAKCRCGCPRHAHHNYSDSCVAWHTNCDCEGYSPRFDDV